MSTALDQSTLGLMFAILGSDDKEEAARIWESNPEERKAAHADMVDYFNKTVATEERPIDDDIGALEETLGALEGKNSKGWITMEERRLFARLLRKAIAEKEVVHNG